MNDLEIYSGRNSHEPSTFSPCTRRRQAENKIAEIGYHSMKDIGTSPRTEGQMDMDKKNGVKARIRRK